MVKSVQFCELYSIVNGHQKIKTKDHSVFQRRGFLSYCLMNGMCLRSHTHEIHPFWEGFVKSPAFNKEGSTARFERFFVFQNAPPLKVFLKEKKNPFLLPDEVSLQTSTTRRRNCLSWFLSVWFFSGLTWVSSNEILCVTTKACERPMYHK